MKEKENITTMPTEHKQVTRRIGTMDTSAYLKEAPIRTELTPGVVGTDAQVMQIAKGMGRKTFNNPMELAESLQGFEDFCVKKNIAPSFIGLSIFLNISKSTLLKYFTDETEFTVSVVKDTLTGEYIYSNIDKTEFDRYIESVYEKDKSGNNYSIKEYIEKGIYKTEYTTITYADVLAPLRSLIELSVTNKGFEMKNPAFAIFTAKNKFGETNHYTDEQHISFQPANPLDDMSDEEILKAAQSLPDDEGGNSKKSGA
mgnify:FL=1